ncbi:MAG: topoisomerase DNA-binding C4 zinc finger domain-containing protein, partial [Acidobacteriota bacterium]
KFIKKQKRVVVNCPREGCDGKLVRRRTKKRTTFYGCSNYPKCDYAVWNLKELEENKEDQDSSG